MRKTWLFQEQGQSGGLEWLQAGGDSFLKATLWQELTSGVSVVNAPISPLQLTAPAHPPFCLILT